MNTYAYLYTWRYLALLLNLATSLTLANENLYVERIGLEQGLPQNNVTAIVQDAKGFIWFGTQTNLSRYDGYKFKEYVNHEDDPNSLSSSSVLTLYVDSHERMWVGTYRGINLYDASHDRFISYQHDPNDPRSLSQNSAWEIIEDKQGYLWVGTEWGLNRFDHKTKTFTRFFYEEDNNTSINSNSINAVFIDRVGDFWIGTDHGLNRYDYANQQFHRIDDAKNILSKSIVVGIGEDAVGRLWVTTSGNGAFVIDQSRKQISQRVHNLSIKGSLSSNKPGRVLLDSKKRLWLGTSDAGLNLLDEKTDRFINFQHDPSNPHSLSENEIVSLYEDNAGVIWVGTYTKGLSKINPYGFGATVHIEYQNLNNPDPLTDVRAIIVDSSGALWVGSSNNGIRVTYPDGKKVSYRHNPNDDSSLNSDRVYSIFEDSDGVIWVGTVSGYLNELDQSRNRFIRHQLSLNADDNIRHGRVSAIDEDSSGLLWLGLRRGGAHTFNRKTKEVVHYHHDVNDKNTLGHNRIFDLVVDRKDNIWFGTFGGGVSHFDQVNKMFTHYRHDPKDKNTISSNYTGKIHEDIKDDVIWVSANVKGFDRFDIKTQTFQHITKESGLSDNNIYSILQQENGHLWVSHNKGISYLNTDTFTFRNYDQKDGLQSNEFNGRADFKAADGKLYFGGIAGYNAFYPEKIVDNPHVPPVYITEFQLFNKPVLPGDNYGDKILLPKVISEVGDLTLSYKDTVFSFEFVALDYANPSSNRYAYMMEGLESDWNYVDSQRRFATYTTLPPGDYTFKVKASNNHGVWNEDGVVLSVSILPPFWLTVWFKIMISAILIISIFIAYKLRVRVINKRNELLEEEVATRTSDLQKTWHELSETKDALIEAAHKAGMTDTATGVLHNVGNLLNSVVISAGLIQKVISTSVLKKFLKVDDLLSKNQNNMSDFLAHDNKGRKLPNYIRGLVTSLKNENDVINENSIRLMNKIRSIKEAITAQQRFAQGFSFMEKRCLEDLVEDSILLQTGSIGRHEIKIIRRFEKLVPKVRVQKAKLIQILINLYQNAKESMDACRLKENILTIEITKDDENAYITYADTGQGIDKDKQDAIFAYGYSTKPGGHGFGLHSCANFMTEMGGKMWVESEGHNKGAKFILSFPLNNENQAINDRIIIDDYFDNGAA